MISSESSDEEFESNLQHNRGVHNTVNHKRPRKSTKNVSEDKIKQQNAMETIGNDNSNSDQKVLDVIPTDSQEIKDRLEKKAERKKRRLEEKKLVAEQAAKKLNSQRSEERKLHGRAYTVSIAIPGSILDNAQTKELKTYLAGQIGRAAAIFQVDEIIVFNDQLGNDKGDQHAPTRQKKANDCHVFMNRILQYLETPQYLRRALFPMHSDLSCAGLLNPLDCPHHLRAHEWSKYREGVVTDRPLKEKEGSHVYVGLQKEVVVDKRIQPGVRVTVNIDETTKDYKKKMKGTLVSSAEPREQLGIYWGYTSRFASSLNQVWNECPFQNDGGYDLKIGTSERGHISVDSPEFKLPFFRHALIVFGGVAGIEECVNADETLPVSGEDSHTLFDMWVNTCPDQGSRTIRSEEALFVSLSVLRKHIVANGNQ